MKIAFVLDDSLDKADGVQQYVITLGHYYQQQGHEVHYLVGQTRRRDIPHVHSLSKNLQVKFNQNRMSTPLPASKSAIRKLLTNEQFDVLHVQVPYSPLLAGRVISAAPATTAIIGTFHIVPYAWQETLATQILRILLWRTRKRFDMLCSVSVPAQKFAKRSFGMRSEVIPNAVNVASFHSGRRLRKYDDGKVNIVFLGRLVERKGCAQLLHALQLLHEDGLLSGLRVLICGKGPENNKLQEYVTKHRMGKSVKFVGFVTEHEKADYLASADIAVFPSTGGESFGIVLVEAMAARAGVVLAGNNSGYRSVLRERPAQLFDPTDTAKFAKVLKAFAFNKPARSRASKWQETQIAQYDVSRVGSQLLRMYERVIAKKQRASDNSKHEPK